MASSEQQADSCTVRRMRPEEIEETFQIIDKIGWNLILNKFSFMFKAFPDKFYVAVTDQGEIAGTVSICPTFNNEYSLGNFVVKESYRGRGLGKKLIQYVLARNRGSVICLASVPEVELFYLKMGFQLAQPQQGCVNFEMVLDRDAVEKQAKAMNTDQITVLPYDDRSLDELVTYDQEARGYRRKEYVEMQTKCYEVFTAKDLQGKLVGYGAAFVTRGMIVLDGLYADSNAIALLLMINILNAFPDESMLKIETPSSRLFLSELGSVTSTYKYNRYSISSPSLCSLSKVYNVGDCDYTW